MKTESRIVVTGSGVISGLGAAGAFAEALFAGKSAVRSGKEPNAAPDASPNAAIAEFTPQTWLGPKGYRYMDRAARLLCVASHLALEDAKFSAESEAPAGEAPGLIYGSMFSSAQSIIAFDWQAITEGPSMVSPLEFPNTVISSPGGQAAIKYHLAGPNSTVCQGFSSSLHAIGQGQEFLKFGRARRLLAGGVEAYGSEIAQALRYQGLLGTGVRPFDPASDGTVPGEGAGLWLLETAHCAETRGMRPLIEIVGFGEAQSESPNAQAGEAAIRQALLAGGIEPAQIGCIITSADGIPAMDNAERDALHAVFGAKLEQIPACAPKAAFGEALGASGILLAMTGMAALLEHRVPPTVGAIRGSGLWLSEKPQPIQASYALVNAFSHDGNAASLILGLWKS